MYYRAHGVYIKSRDEKTLEIKLKNVGFQLRKNRLKGLFRAKTVDKGNEDTG